ncbi:hypothetical protein N2152v2_007476 [Parachlorella kessleri]
MGSGRDKRKKVKGKVPGKGAEKTAKKTEKNSEKSTRRVERKAVGGEDDIDALLAQFKLKDAQVDEVRVLEGKAPTARVYASFVPLPSQKENEVLLFGGEWYDADRDKTHVYAEIFVYNTDKDSWRQVVSPNGPLPRTSHQAVIHKGYMYVFGGEFTSLNQEKFRHYSDLWRLSLADWRWEQLPSKGGPSARSGHRMAVYKNTLLLFGGFFDTGRETKYYNDLWAFSIEELKWEALGPQPGQPAPSARGGCQLAAAGDSLYLFGGYSVLKAEPQGEGSLAKRKAKDEDNGKGVTHDDIWCLDLKSHQWERVKKAGMAPGARTSFGMVTHKRRAVLFGGILDREGQGDKLYSELFNELYQFNFDSRRWFPMVVRPPRKQQQQQQAARQEDGAEASDSGDSGTAGSQPQHGQQPQEGIRGAAAAAAVDSGEAEQQEEAKLPPRVSPEMHAILQKAMADKSSAFHRAAVRIQSRYRGYVVRKAYTAYRLGGQISELLYSPATYGIDLSAKDMIKPRARASPMMTVLKNTLWMWGGTVEIETADVNLDDMWSLELNKLDGWRCVKENSMGEEAFKDISTDEEDSSSSDSDG